MPQRYQPDERLIENPSELHRLYHEEDLSVRAIAENHAEVSIALVYQALVDHDVIAESDQRDTPRHEKHGERGVDPPTVDWSIAV